MNTRLKMMGLWLVGMPLMVTAIELPQEVVINQVEFVHVPGGEFWHTVPGGAMTEQNHLPFDYRDVRVSQDGFYIAKYEARARDFMRFSQSDAWTSVHESHYEEGAEKGCAVLQQGGNLVLTQPENDLPITHLTWQLAHDMAEWLGFRLPTEAEWVVAARGTEDNRPWPWGFEYPDDTFAGYEGGSSCNPVAIGLFPNGASPYGAYDMSGNVYEYVDDWYNPLYYLGLKEGTHNPKPKEAMAAASMTDGQMVPLKLLKGGRWTSVAVDTTIQTRMTTQPERGFRCYGTRFAIDETEVMDHLKAGTADVIRP